jgi:cbb3-type cytochrome oxidase subunit 1
MRLLGGLVYFVGMVVMAYNVYKTVAKEKPVPVAVMDPA